MATSTGNVTNVVEVPMGSVLTSNVATGVSSLTPADIDEFDFDGGQLQIGDEIFTYTVNTTTSTLAISGTTAAAYLIEEPVLVYPLQMERLAYVFEPGNDEELEVRVPHSLYAELATGTRSDDEQELVEANLVGGELVIADVIARRPEISSAFVDIPFEQTMVSGATASPGVYVAAAPALTITPEENALAVVHFGISVSASYAEAVLISILVDGVQTGPEQKCSGAATAGELWPVSGMVLVPMAAGVTYNVAVAIKKTSGGGGFCSIQADKSGGLGYYLFAG